jgi:hypothetical protein
MLLDIKPKKFCNNTVTVYYPNPNSKGAISALTENQGLVPQIICIAIMKLIYTHNFNSCAIYSKYNKLNASNKIWDQLLWGNENVRSN